MPKIKREPFNIFKATGVARVKTRQGLNVFKVGSTIPDNSPVIYCEKSGNYAVFEWEELIKISLREGIIESRDDS